MAKPKYQRDNDNSFVEELDSFLIESGRRRVALCRRRNPSKPFVVVVYVERKTMVGQAIHRQEIILSSSEYITEETARRDFEIRRPKMRDSVGEEVPMQRGKRLVQEMLTDKLGPSDKQLKGSGL